jgi:hypothetical protein
MPFTFARTLIEPLTIEGQWRISPRKREVPGTLHFTPDDGIELRLNGTFFDPRRRQDPDSVVRIVGYTVNGRHVTLLECVRSGGQLNIPGYFVSRYRARVGTIGHKWYRSNRHLRFRDLQVTYHNLEEFSGFTGLNLKRPGRRLSVEYRQPRLTRLRLDGYRIEVGLRGWTAGDGRERLAVEQQAWITVRSKTAEHLDSILDGPLRTISNVLELACGRPVPMLAIRAVERVQHDSRSFPEETEVLFAQTNPLPPRARLHPRELAFTLTMLGPNVSATIGKWHQSRKRLGPTVDLLFSVERMHRPPVEHVFLFLAQALESYHRRTWGTQESDRRQFRRRVERMLASVRPQDRAWLADRLKYSGEPSLNRRLKDLYESLPAPTQSLLGKKQDFCRDISVTRHYFTHFDKRLQKEALKGSELWLATVKLRLMLRITLLRELGLTAVDKLREQRLLEQYAK